MTTTVRDRDRSQPEPESELPALWSMPVEGVTRVRTGEKGDDAI